MREKLSMDFAWRFHLDNFERPVPSNMMFYYNHTKAERALGPAAASFYDGDWEIVDLPHDYAIAGGIDFTASDTEGFVRRQNGWYRRLFSLAPEDKGRRIVLLFDGIATHAVVWVNGHLLYRNFCGYTSFYVDVTEFVNYGDLLNEVSVYVDTRDFEGWWYEGAGIYRHVWMLKTAPICVETWGTYIRTKKEKYTDWTVSLHAEIRSILYSDREIAIRCVIRDDLDQILSEERKQFTALAREKTKCSFTLPVRDPKLWSVDHPELYTAEVRIELDGREIDRYDTVFGFRTIAFTTEGFFLNGEKLKLKGVCAHEDHANLGVAVPDEVRELRMRTLKSIGCNAYRCSHNPPTPEVLDLCDRLGILVMDENRWFDSSVEGLSQLRHMLIRDRNHPSVIMWSMANEEPIQGTERGQQIMKSMRFEARKLDDTRPIMMAMHSGCLDKDGVAGVSDVIGINYQIELYDQIHEAFPDIPLVASEVGGKMLPFGIMGDGSGEDWEAANTRDYFLGMFKWVAFGYRGESRGWPRLFSRSGIIEPTAAAKENTWFYKQMWDEKDSFVKIWPKHWNWPGREGEQITVSVYSNAETVSLYQDGRLLESRKVDPYARTRFRVLYAPGELTATAERDGKLCEDVIRTTGLPHTLTMEASRTKVNADRTSTVIVEVTASDKNGDKCLWATNHVRFQINGPASLLAVSNNDPYNKESASAPEHDLFDGYCQLVLKTTAEPGTIRITAAGEGMEPGTLEIESLFCIRPPHVAQETDTDAMWYFAKMDGPN